MNFIPGRLAGQPRVLTDDGLAPPLVQRPRGEHGARVLYGTRPEHFTLDDAGLAAQVTVVEPTGAETQIAARLGGQQVIAAFRQRIAARPGDSVTLLPQPAHAHVFDAASGQRLN
jgi:multiple sugar transport system ATP-binding protein